MKDSESETDLIPPLMKTRIEGPDVSLIKSILLSENLWTKKFIPMTRLLEALHGNKTSDLGILLDWRYERKNLLVL